ncbi:MAG: DNA transposition protein [Tistlia sp.]
MELLEWQPPAVAVKFTDHEVRAVSLAQRVSRAIAVTLRECDADREEVAARMSEYLGEPVSKNMLDAYASQARESHNISLARTLALIHATGDARVLGSELERFDLVIIPRRFLAAVDEAMWAEQEERAHAERTAARRRWKGGR